MSDSDTHSDDNKTGSRHVVIRNTVDFQRIKLEKLMKNPDKPIIIPERPKEKSFPNVPDFVRNVMGSSAGAGSGEFHVYRHLRRKEYARQRYIKEKSERERLNEEYHQKIEENRKAADEKTAKKRAKRLKKKMKAKERGKKPKIEKQSSSSEEISEHSDVEEITENKNDECIIKEKITDESASESSEPKQNIENEAIPEKVEIEQESLNKNSDNEVYT